MARGKECFGGRFGGSTEYLFQDQLGSINRIVDADGAEVETRAYAPFGAMIEQTGLQPLEVETKGWIGERYDAGAGLQYLNARYYDPELGLFLQPDWFEVTKAGVGTNRYSYSFNDPVNKLDRLGNDAMNGLMVGLTDNPRRAHLAQVRGTISFLLGMTDVAKVFVADIDALSAPELTVDYGLEVISTVPGLKPLKAAKATKATKLCSFHGDTLVATPNGGVAISDITAGMSVLSADPSTGALVTQRVTDAYSNPYDATVFVTIQSASGTQTITSNRIHPFFAILPDGVVAPANSEGHEYAGPIIGGAWVEAQHLTEGMGLRMLDGSEARVASVRIEDTPLLAFNLSVAETETYFVAEGVGDTGVWVHNCRSAKGLIGAAYEEHLISNLSGGFKPNKLKDPVSGRRKEIDAGYIRGNTKAMVEAKSGGYWERATSDPKVLNKFKAQVKEGKRASESNGFGYEVRSNSKIPDDVKSWLKKNEIDFAEDLD